MNNLRHIAIIMDGNGRWASLRGKSRSFGHIRGARKAKEIISFTNKLRGVEVLTLFAFSTENWNRPAPEVNFLMSLIGRTLTNYLEYFIENNIKVNVIGNKQELPESIIKSIQNIELQTEHCKGLNVVIALNYSGRFDIIQAVNEIVNSKTEDYITAEKLNNQMLTKDLPPPDIILRTGDERRISNFYLWQAAYSEIFFIKKMWPDFQPIDLESCILEYEKIQRRYGSIECDKRPEPKPISG